MYGGLGGGTTSAVTGGVSTVAGVAALPNTGGSPLLIALSLATIVVGVAIMGSFAVTRIAIRRNR